MLYFTCICFSNFFPYKNVCYFSKEKTFRNSLSHESASSFWQPLPERHPPPALQGLDRVQDDGPAQRIGRLAT